MMETTEMSGYTHKITIDLGNETNLTACFNNGGNSWDSANGSNYIFNAGTYGYSGGTITKLQDPVKTFGIDSFTTNVISPQNVGTEVTLNATTSNGKGLVQTKFTVSDGTTTTIIKDYSTVNTTIWKATKAGTYTLTAYVKDSNGKEVSKEIIYVISDTIAKNETTIYYRGYVAPYIHYRIGNATSLTACFNNGSGSWDSRNGANYIFNAGKYTYFNGTSVLIN